MNPSVELSLIVRRYLRRCARSGDTQALTSAGLLTSDRHFLDETAYWCGNAHLKPAIGVQIAIDWNALWSQVYDDSTPPPDHPSPAEEMTTDLCEYYRSCALIPNRLEELATASTSSAIIEQVLLAPVPPVFSETAASAVSARLKIDRQQVKRIQRYSERHASELRQHLRLVASGATYDLMKQLTGCTTHEFAALRKITAIDHPRGRIRKPTPDKLQHIRELISMVCSKSNQPGIAEYLEFCDHIEHSDLSLGEIHAAQLQEAPPD